MIKQVNDYLTGIPMTVVGGVFLAVSLALDLTGKSMAVDPAWATILISGIPLLYLAISRALYNQGMKKISSAMLIS